MNKFCDWEKQEFDNTSFETVQYTKEMQVKKKLIFMNENSMNFLLFIFNFHSVKGQCLYRGVQETPVLGPCCYSPVFSI